MAVGDAEDLTFEGVEFEPARDFDELLLGEVEGVEVLSDLLLGNVGSQSLRTSELSIGHRGPPYGWHKNK